MSGENRKKKDGERVEKKIQRSKEASKERHREFESRPPGEERDQGDIMAFKPGAQNDRTQRGAR